MNGKLKNRLFDNKNRCLTYALLIAIMGFNCLGCSKKSDVTNRSESTYLIDDEGESDFEEGFEEPKRTMTYQMEVIYFII